MTGKNLKKNSKESVVLVRYPIEIRKEKCAVCKRKGVFLCEHDTYVRDEIHSSYIQEGRFYLDPRKSKTVNSYDFDTSRSDNFENKMKKLEKNKFIPDDDLNTNENETKNEDVPIVEQKIDSERNNSKTTNKKSAYCNLI
ncbi:unnamed protein product [Brachionus calyciflorus]|uniref:Uncharacterized protein n=1 Tax=Brachionus calyciflorus TaxID=104777 RepID=A0A813MNN0_9BILA|nr:unnamed protein product [Brachionus calyciflorus]